MEHFAQLAASLRGGVRRGVDIAPQGQPDAEGVTLTTLGDYMGMQSNIFKIVVT
jgi:hypothetical protein